MDIYHAVICNNNGVQNLNRHFAYLCGWNTRQDNIVHTSSPSMAGAGNILGHREALMHGQGRSASSWTVRRSSAKKMYASRHQRAVPLPKYSGAMNFCGDSPVPRINVDQHVALCTAFSASSWPPICYLSWLDKNLNCSHWLGTARLGSGLRRDYCPPRP